MNIELNEVEQRLAEFVAKKRIAANRGSNTPDEQIGTQDKLFIEINGVGGELAACKAANLYPDLTIATTGARPVHDFILDGETWDVKTTDREYGRLLVRKSKAEQGKLSEYYVLVIGAMPSYRIAGYAHKDEIVEEDNLMDLGYGPTYALPQSKLHPWSWIMTPVFHNMRG